LLFLSFHANYFLNRNDGFDMGVLSDEARLMQRIFWTGLVGVVAGVIATDAVSAQVRPDATLGAESSRVRNERIRGRDSERIEGGARRNGNLFHSFDAFGVEAGRGAYFNNPANVQNIFSRVTGSTPSRIEGTLGVIQEGSSDVLGTANLFFMNPNGILFGPNSSLDLGGSFVGTTANAIQFGEQGFFNASGNGVPQSLLKVNPNAFFFSQITPSPIINNSVAPVTEPSPAGLAVLGLRVPDGESLVLLGGDIGMDGGRLNAFGGRIELGGLATTGSVGLGITGERLRLSFPTGSALANLTLANDARVAVRGGGGGEIAVNSNRFTATNGGRLVNGIETTGNAGDITVNANQIRFSGVNASGSNAAGIYQEVVGGGVGNPGNSIIDTNVLDIGSGGQIASYIRANASGNVGVINVDADTISLTEGGGIRSEVYGQGRGGDIRVTADGNLNVQSGAQVNASTFGAGRAGDVNVTANSIDLLGASDGGQTFSAIASEANLGSTGNAGNVTVSSRLLNIQGGAAISSSTFSSGRGGNLDVTARESATLSGIVQLANGQLSSSRLSSTTAGAGRAGDLRFSVGQLRIQNGAAITASTSSTGRAGDVNVTADSIDLLGASDGGQNVSAIGSETFTNSTGDAGNVTVSSRLLNIQDGASISTSSFGSGQGGRLDVTARESATLSGTVQRSNGLSSSGLFSITAGAGRAGDLRFSVGQLRIQNGAQVIASTFGAGRAGDVNVSADSINLIGASSGGQNVSGIGSETGSTGDVGNVTVESRLLNIQDGAAISSSTFGSGQGGRLNVTARESATLSGAVQRSNGLYSSGLRSITAGTGNAGEVRFSVGQLRIQNGAQVNASTSGAGRAGDVNVVADSIDLLGTSDDRQNVSFVGSETFTNSTGDAGNVTVESRLLNIQDGAAISSSTFGSGQGGRLNVTARESATLSGTVQIANGQLSSSRLSSTTAGAGNAGEVRFSVGQLKIEDGAQVNASTSGAGRAGDVNVSADSIDLIGISDSRQSFSTVVSEANLNSTGDAGNVTVSSRLLNIQGGAAISSSTFGSGQGGRLNVTARESATLSGAAQLANGQISNSRISSQTTTTGRAGEVNVTAPILRLQDRAIISTNTFGSGQAGDLKLQAGRLLVRGGASISASTSGASGQAGDITIKADAIDMAGISTDRTLVSGISSQSEVDSATGTIAATGDAGNIDVTTRILRLENGAGISTSTAGEGRGGDLQVIARESAELSGTATLANGQVFPSRLFTNAFGSGRAGNLQVTTGELNIRGGAAITASTNGSGRAGNVQVEADSIRLSGTSRTQPRRQQFPSSIGSETFSKAEDAGNAGNVRVSTTRLNIRDRAAISTATFGRGNAGDIDIRSQQIRVLDDGRINSSVASGARGNGGEIRLQTGSLLVDGGQIGAAVFRPSRDAQNILQSGGRGRGGDILITADEITLTGITPDGFSSGILTLSERGAFGRAGDITIETGDFQIADGAIVVASTFNRGDGGNIDINADSFEAVNGGQVVTNTRERGTAGTITLNAEEIRLSGADPNFQNRRERVRNYTERPNITDRVSDVIVNQGRLSGLFANTSGRGEGGEIDVNTTNLTLNNQAEISSASRGRNLAGGAGDISIIATDELQAEGGNITTSSVSSAGGSIQITGGGVNLEQGSSIRTDVKSEAEDGGDIRVDADIVRLRDNSDIETQIGLDGTGDGGDINVRANAVIAYDDSDIITTAPQGQGGDITLNTPAFFGAGYQNNSDSTNTNPSNANNNGRVDLDASGEVSSGSVQTPDTSFIQNSLSNLPVNALNTEALLANSCIARTDEGGTFLITGSGGLPSNRPGSSPLSAYPTDRVRSETPAKLDWQPGDAIIEPQGVYRLPNGELVLMHECGPELYR
jgi:filamentous hemagglutinin family protein